MTKNIIALSTLVLAFLMPSSAFAATLTLTPKIATYNQACTYAADITLDTEGEKTDGTDVILLYDPTKISVLSIDNGSLYQSYLGKTIDNDNGRVTVTGLSSLNSNFNGKGIFATVNFAVKKTSPVGDASIRFDFDPSNPSKTTDSNVVETGTVADILRAVADFLFSIAQNTFLTDPSPTPTPSPTPSPTPTPTPTPSPTPSPTPTPTPPGEVTLNSQVNQPTDDVNEINNSLDTMYSTLWLGNGESANGSYLGIRFNSLNVPQGAKIKKAYLEVFSIQDQWISLSYDIFADNVSNSQTFSQGLLPSQRVLTGSSVSHSSDVSWSANTWNQLDEISAVLQEIVNRSDWQSGNSVSLIIKGKGGSWARKFVQSYDNSASLAPKLTVVYQ